MDLNVKFEKFRISKFEMKNKLYGGAAEGTPSTFYKNVGDCLKWANGSNETHCDTKETYGDWVSSC